MMEQLQELCRMLDKYNVKHGSVDPMTAPALCRKLKVVAKHDAEAMLIIAGVNTYLSDKEITSESSQPGVQTITVKRHVAVATVEETKETKTEGQVMDNVTVGLTPAQQVGVRRIADEVFIFSKIGKLPITPAVREQLVAEFGNSVLRYEQRIGTSAAAADFIDVGADITERDAIIGSITELTARLLLNPVDADIQLAKSMLNPGKIGEQAAAGAAGISSEIPGEAPKAEAAKKKSIKDRLLFWKQTEKPTTTTLSEQMAFISGLAGLMDTSAFNPEPTVTAAAA